MVWNHPKRESEMSSGGKLSESSSSKCSCIFKLREPSPSQLNQQKSNSKSNFNYISPA